MALPLTFWTRKQLDAAGCDTPNCGHDHTVIFVHPICHPGKGCSVSYDKRNGLLTLECRTCKKLVTRMLVAADAEFRQ